MAKQKHEELKKPVLFLFLLLLSGISIIIIYSFVFSTEEEQYHLFQNTISGVGKITIAIAILFKFADHWNWMLITFLFSISVVIICLNDIFLRNLLNKRVKTPINDFWKGGLVWFGKISVNLFIFFLQVVVFSYLINVSSSSPHIFSANEIRKGKYTILLLGTSKYLQNSKAINKYYQERIDATVVLFKSGYIKNIVISGDHQGSSYSEPTDMMNDLIKRGVSKKCITLDLTGFRTFDSIRKTKSLAGNNEIIVVSQMFHLERALFLAKSEGIDAIGVAANGTMTLNMMKREMFAKTKVLLDIYVFNTQAYGLPAHPRRPLTINNKSDIILLLFVLSTVFLAGRLSRLLLQY